VNVCGGKGEGVLVIVLFMKVVLAEKPSVGRDIARCLGCTQKHNGYLSGYDGKVAVTWTFGHLVELEAPDGYDPSWKRWSLQSLPMLPEAFRLRARRGDGIETQLNCIAELLQQATEIVCATDAGREGELIFRYVLQWAGCEEKPIRRLWLSSMTDAAIKQGFSELRDGHDLDPLAAAARCRSEADWIVGMNGTRFFTVKYGRQGELWSVGRVQTPVLAMIVGRDLEREDFRAKDYWDLRTLYRDAIFKHDGKRIDDEARAEALREKVAGGPLRITHIDQKSKSFRAPLLYDLTALQREMNKRFGMTAKQTLAAAQKLYERKHMTYPRTDSRYLGKAMVPELPRILSSIRPHFGSAVDGLNLKALKPGKRVVDDSKVGDHHAIIPTDHPPRSPLHGDEAKLYEAIAMRFISAFYPPCVKWVTRVDAEAAAEPFKATGSVVREPGWQALFPDMLKAKKRSKTKSGAEGDDDTAEDDSQILPEFKEGESGPHKPYLEKKKTKPPRALTEASLLQFMETAGKLVDDDEMRDAMKERGLGTPATRAAIIETLLGRGYIARKGKQLLSTDMGRELIAIIENEQLKSPELTGEWEALLKRIERGEYAPETFMSKVVEHTGEIISQTSRVKRVRRLGPCPLCEGSVIEGARGYGCSRWKAGCEFVLWKKQFGRTLHEAEVLELLSERRTTSLLTRKTSESTLVYGTLLLRADGSVEVSPASNSAKVQERRLVGNCPLCGSSMIEGDKGYGCIRWREGCHFVVWKQIAQRKIPLQMVRVLLRDGLTPFIEKFKRQDGTRFDARLKIEDGGKVGFDFTPKENPKPKPAASVSG
jgi:DNA topoisomerase-3